MEPTFSPAWFATFGRRDSAETAREVDFLVRVLPSPPSTVLDVPCGFGRHAQALARHGYRVTGVERDPSVAAEARACGVDVHEVDVRRLDEVSGSFSAVICMWASFGWFDDETNADVFASMGAKTKDTLVLDLYTPAFFRTHQGRGDNRGVSESRRIEGNRLRTTLDYTDGSRDSFDWRLYEPEELRELGLSVGLRLDLVCADFSEQPPTAETPRTQLVFRTRYLTSGRAGALRGARRRPLRPERRRRAVADDGHALREAGRKMVIGFSRSDGAMTFKLPDPDAHARALALDRSHLFDPSGKERRSRNWWWSRRRTLRSGSRSPSTPSVPSNQLFLASLTRAQKTASGSSSRKTHAFRPDSSTRSK